MKPFDQTPCDVDLMRKRPDRYFRDLSVLGTHQYVIAGILDAYYEARRECCNSICIEFHEDGAVTVSDDGRPIQYLFEQHLGLTNVGLPIKPTLLSTREGRMITDEEFILIPEKRRELGLFLPLAASTQAELITRREDGVYVTRFEKGYCSKDEKLNEAVEALGEMNNRFSYRMDSAVLSHPINAGMVRGIVSELRGYAAVTAGLRIIAIDHFSKMRHEFYYPNGIADYAAEMGCVPQSYDLLQPFYYRNAVGESVEIVRLDPVLSPRIFQCFVNGFPTGTFGHHWAAILGAMADLGPNSPIRYPDDVSLILNMKLKSFDFKNQTDLIGNNIYLLVYNAFISYINTGF